MQSGTFTVAAVQRVPSIPFDKQKTIDIVCEAIEEAAGEGADPVVFPECFVPMYPNWSIDLQNPNEWALNLREFTRNNARIPNPPEHRDGERLDGHGTPDHSQPNSGSVRETAGTDYSYD